jgi:hypothetical protein
VLPEDIISIVDHATGRKAAMKGAIIPPDVERVLVAFSTLTTFLECGFGECPNDGSWDWWILR